MSGLCPVSRLVLFELALRIEFVFTRRDRISAEKASNCKSRWPAWKGENGKKWYEHAVRASDVQGIAGLQAKCEICCRHRQPMETSPAASLRTHSSPRHAGLLGHASNGGTQFATDTPAFKYVAFRYSSGTDSTIKAVCATDASHITAVDTTVSVDTTNSQNFQIVNTGSSFIFLINDQIRATISTNIPAAADTFLWGWYGDNKNTATAIGASMWWATLMVK
jgi:hypothetical protein